MLVTEFSVSSVYSGHPPIVQCWRLETNNIVTELSADNISSAELRDQIQVVLYYALSSHTQWPCCSDHLGVSNLPMTQKSEVIRDLSPALCCYTTTTTMAKWISLATLHSLEYPSPLLLEKVSHQLRLSPASDNNAFYWRGLEGTRRRLGEIWRWMGNKKSNEILILELQPNLLFWFLD